MRSAPFRFVPVTSLRWLILRDFGISPKEDLNTHTVATTHESGDAILFNKITLDLEL